MNMTQAELKKAVAAAALVYVPENSVIGIGTGSTVNQFIAALAREKIKISAAVSSSSETSALLKEIGIPVMDANKASSLSVYIDGADEIDSQGNMIKGGGAALTQEKIVASLAKTFVCIADESKIVPTLGRFPLPIEIIPSAASAIKKRLAALGGVASLRLKNDKPLITDNGQYILDVKGLKIDKPLFLEQEINNWPGVVTVGIFAIHKAKIALISAPTGIKTFHY